MGDKQETVADIVCEMREYDNTPPPRRAWIDLADRIEAAYKREVNARAIIAAASLLDGEVKTLSELEISPAPWKIRTDSSPKLYESLRKLLIVAKNRMPSQPTVHELEMLMEAENALEKASGEREVTR